MLLRETWSGLHRPTIPFRSASTDSVALEEKEAMGTCYSTCFQPKTAVEVDGSTGLALDTLEDCISPDPNVHCLGALPGQTAHCFERYERVGARLYVTVLHLSLCSSKAHFTTKTNVQTHKWEEKKRDLNGRYVEAQIWPVNKTL